MLINRFIQRISSLNCLNIDGKPFTSQGYLHHFAIINKLI